MYIRQVDIAIMEKEIFSSIVDSYNSEEEDMVVQLTCSSPWHHLVFVIYSPQFLQHTLLFLSSTFVQAQLMEWGRIFYPEKNIQLKIEENYCYQKNISK